MFPIVTVIIFLAGQVNGQYGNLASLIGDSLTPNILGNSANGASGLLGTLGTLYQIAQGALRLTGTGVGILNQASEGRWFNKAIEEAKNLGINFPAPSPADYDREITKLEGLIPFSPSNITTTETTKRTDTPLITLFPEETEKINPKKKENRNSISEIDVDETGEVIDRFRNKKNPDIKEFNDCDHEEKQTDKKLELVKEKVAKLERFIALLYESNITENDLNKLMQLLEREKTVKSKSINKSSITAPPIIFRRIGSVSITDNEDNDLLPSTTTRSRARAVRIKYEPHSGSIIDSRSTIFNRPRKYPRRVAYRARLPFLTNATHIDVQSETNMNKRVIPQIHLTEQKSEILEQPFLQPAVPNLFGQAQTPLAAPIFGIFQTPTFAPPIYPQAMNVIQSQPSSYTTILENHNQNNRLQFYQKPAYILERPNMYFNSNSNLLIPPFYNQNSS
ncbi:unnamed protein product [Cercopithifilaria johnstoni]|uniref:Uncharacterized protein n=1 Tax=Cercopithifilaria johnstoni TaxID=2874296 RepID=A0A8J2MPG1_9BILA|nr:unnamed protein product [Cercopithifilaria johnstoni]